MKPSDPSIVRTTFMWQGDEAGIRSTSTSEGGGMTITGYAAVFGKSSRPLRFPSVNRGRPFLEIIEPSAFNRTLNSGRDVALLWQHDPTQLPLASTAAGTMRLSTDAIGLRVEADLPDNEHGRPVRDAIARGDVRGMSFRMPQTSDNARADGTFPIEKLPGGTSAPMRRIHEVKLMPEVSITNMPAYDDASVSMRSIAEEMGLDPDALEDAMRSFESGLLTPMQRDVIVDAATKRAAAAFVCCEACGDGASNCCNNDSRCPAGCTGAGPGVAGDPDAGCQCGCVISGAAGIVVPAARSEPDPLKLAEMRSRLNAIR